MTMVSCCIVLRLALALARLAKAHFHATSALVPARLFDFPYERLQWPVNVAIFFF